MSVSNASMRHWRERALAAEARVRELEEAQGQLLNLIDPEHAEWIAFNDFWPTAGGGVRG